MGHVKLSTWQIVYICQFVVSDLIQVPISPRSIVQGVKKNLHHAHNVKHWTGIYYLVPLFQISVHHYSLIGDLSLPPIPCTKVLTLGTTPPEKLIKDLGNELCTLITINYTLTFSSTARGNCASWKKLVFESELFW